MTEPAEDRSSSILPIVIAAAIVIVAMGSMWALTFFRTDDKLPDDGLVVRAVVAQNDALQRENYTDFRSYTCAAQQGTEPQVLSDQRQSKNTKGNRFVNDIKDFAITGDRATATVAYHFEKSPDDTVSQPMTFVRENGAWKVCSPGPR
jgi:hypothetical protein